MTSVLWFSKMTLSECLFLVVTMAVTAAALHLSSTSNSRASLASSADVGIGPSIARYCSPCKSFAGLKSGRKSSSVEPNSIGSGISFFASRTIWESSGSSCGDEEDEESYSPPSRLKLATRGSTPSLVDAGFDEWCAE